MAHFRTITQYEKHDGTYKCTDKEYATQGAAEAAFHTMMSEGAGDDQYAVYSCVVIDERGFMVRNEFYEHEAPAPAEQESEEQA